MNQNEVIQHVCETVGIIYHGIADYRYTSDGFCSRCPASTKLEWDYQNVGWTLDYMRKAVVEQLKRDGFITNPVEVQCKISVDVPWPLPPREEET